MELGSAFHTLMLEPHLFADNYTIKPPKVLLKDVGREVYDVFKRTELTLESTNKIVLSQEDYLNLLAMEKKILSSEQAMQLLSDGIIEQSYFWKDKDSGLMLKARPDVIHRNMYVDIKTCADASPRAYQHSMIDGGYHLQAAMVRDAIRHHENRDMNTTINICVENKYPYTVAIYIIDEAAIDHAEAQYKRNLRELKDCLEKDVWPSYETRTIGLPAWIT